MHARCLQTTLQGQVFPACRRSALPRPPIRPPALLAVQAAAAAAATTSTGAPRRKRSRPSTADAAAGRAGLVEGLKGADTTEADVWGALADVLEVRAGVGSLGAGGSYPAGDQHDEHAQVLPRCGQGGV